MVLSTKTKVKLSLSLIVIVLLIISGSWAYFKFYVKTPSYTIKTTVEAIKDHNWKKFQANVDVDSLANSVAQPLLITAMDNQGEISPDTKEMLTSWIKMFKTPVVASIKEGMAQYVEHGNWDVANESQDGDGAVINPKYILEQIGLTDMEFIGVDNIITDPQNEHLAYAEIKVKQAELDKETTLKLKMVQGEDGYWKITEIANFQDFLDFLKKSQREQMDNYLKNTSVLYKEQTKIDDANQTKLSNILAAGTLGNDKTRQELVAFINNEALPQLKDFKNKLTAVNTPAPAKTLQHLRLEVVDNKIAYLEAYSQWLGNKDIKTLRKATDSLNKYQTMEDDADALLKRITAQLQ